MPERKEYAPGTPSWVDLQTTDQAAAKSFYGALFGWNFDDLPIDESGDVVYSMARLQGLDVAAIAAIDIRTYEFAYREIGSGREKWRPATRETADHSLPYIVAAALVDGTFSDAIFAPARFTDPRILALADRIAIAEDPALTRAFPQKFPCRVEVTLNDGSRRAAAREVPHGHHDDPLTDAEVEAKFRALAGRKLAPDRVERALQLIADFERFERIDDLFAASTIDGADWNCST